MSVSPPTGPGAARPRRPDPPPLEIDESKVIAVGVVCWGVALIVLLAFHSQLARRHDSWWPWTCVAGIGLGFWGWLLVRKRVAERTANRGRRPDTTAS
jgi:H+/Cl- antiporter ClcA